MWHVALSVRLLDERVMKNNRRSVRKLGLLFIVWQLAINPIIAAADDMTITAPLAEKLIRAALQSAKEKNFERVKVRSVVGCYPIAGRAPDERLCAIDMTSRKGGTVVEELVFKKTEKEWTFVPPEQIDGMPAPSCPPRDVVLPMLSKAMNDPKLEVVEVPVDGLLSDVRGKFRDETGPLRLMCTFVVKRSLGEQTVVAYFNYLGGAYQLEPKLEVWNE